MTKPLIAFLRGQLCWRLAFSVADPLLEVAEPGDLPALMEALADINGLDDGASLVERVFASPNPSGSRFADGSFGIFYAAYEVETCVAEVAHHHRKRLLEATAPKGTLIHFRAIQAAVSGTFLDVREGHPELHDPMDYKPSQAFGRMLQQSQGDGVVYGSVRRAGGICVGVLRRQAVQHCVQGPLVALQWDGHQLQAA